MLVLPVTNIIPNEPKQSMQSQKKPKDGILYNIKPENFRSTISKYSLQDYEQSKSGYTGQSEAVSEANSLVLAELIEKSESVSVAISFVISEILE